MFYRSFLFPFFSIQESNKVWWHETEPKKYSLLHIQKLHSKQVLIKIEIVSVWMAYNLQLYLIVRNQISLNLCSIRFFIQRIKYILLWFCRNKSGMFFDTYYSPKLFISIGTSTFSGSSIPENIMSGPCFEYFYHPSWELIISCLKFDYFPTKLDHWLVPSQDVHFFYTCSHLSALQNCALLFPDNSQFNFIFKYFTTHSSYLIV